MPVLCALSSVAGIAMPQQTALEICRSVLASSKKVAAKGALEEVANALSAAVNKVQAERHIRHSGPLRIDTFPAFFVCLFLALFISVLLI